MLLLLHLDLAHHFLLSILVILFLHLVQLDQVSLVNLVFQLHQFYLLRLVVLLTQFHLAVLELQVDLVVQGFLVRHLILEFH